MRHDQLFKELLQTFFGEFLLLFFPEAAHPLDLSSVNFVSKALSFRQVALSGLDDPLKALLAGAIEQYMPLDSAEEAEFRRVMSRPEMEDVPRMISAGWPCPCCWATCDDGTFTAPAAQPAALRWRRGEGP